MLKIARPTKSRMIAAMHSRMRSSCTDVSARGRASSNSALTWLTAWCTSCMERVRKRRSLYVEMMVVLISDAEMSPFASRSKMENAARASSGVLKAALKSLGTR